MSQWYSKVLYIIHGWYILVPQEGASGKDECREKSRLVEVSVMRRYEGLSVPGVLTTFF
jgi:hypothetical protein